MELFLSENYKIISESLTIAVDASIAKECFLGDIFISNDGIFPGKGVEKNLPYVGNMSIRGITCDSRKRKTIDEIIDAYYYGIDIIPMTNIVVEALVIALDKIFKKDSEPCKKLVQMVIIT